MPAGYLAPALFNSSFDEAVISTNLSDPPTNYEIFLGNVDLTTILISSSSFDPWIDFEYLFSEVDGYKIGSFLNDYYFRIHITPSTFDLFILEEIVETFIVWNAYFDKKTCAEIIATNEDQYDRSGLTAPFDLKPLELTTYTLTFTTIGEPSFESTILFDFTTDFPEVYISAVRVVLFPWRPQQPMIETMNWLTDIITSKDGSEQRIAIRKVPRQMYKLNFVLQTELEQSRFDALMFGWQKRVLGLPVWTDYVEHHHNIDEDDLIINVDTTNADFRDNSFGVIWKSQTDFRIIQIDAVSPSSITLAVKVGKNFLGRKFIMPCRFTHITSMINRRDVVRRATTFDLAFAVRDNTLLTGYTPPTTYKDLPVITSATKIADGFEKTIDGDTFITDYGVGEFEFRSDSLFNILAQTHQFLLNSKSDCWEFKKFMHSLYGMRNPVWIPTFRNDLQLTANIGSGDTLIKIRNINLAKNMRLNTLRTHLAFIFPDNTMILREITGMTEISEYEETVNIDASLGVSVPLTLACKISFLDKYRLGSDTVDIQWLMKNKLKCKTNFVAVTV